MSTKGGRSVITKAKFGYRDRITINQEKLPNYRRPRLKGPSRLSHGSFEE